MSTTGRAGRRSLGYLAVVAVTVVYLARGALAMDVRLQADQHRWMSLDIALNKTFCAEPSALSTRFGTRESLERPYEVVTSFRELLRDEAGSVEEYCRSLTPYLNNENSLMLLMRAALLMNRGLSPRGLGQVLLLVRVAFLLCFSYVLLRCGASVLWCVCFLACSLALLRALADRGYSVYPFLLVLPLGSVALYSVAATVGPPRLGAHALFSALGGSLAAFHANMRTSHLPMLLALFLVYTAVRYSAAKHLRPSLTRGWALGWWLGGVLAFMISYAAFSETFIRPLEAVTPRVQVLANYSYHPVAHPLVLSLAYPDSALSRREGIGWTDEAGLRLAKEMVPTVAYLGPTYERALLLYYVKLWLLYPREMVDIYQMKATIAGKDMLSKAEQLPVRRLWVSVLAPLRAIPSGGALLLVFLLVALVSVTLSAKKGWPLAFLMTLSGVAACLSLLESMATVPFFRVDYHSYLLLFTVLVGLLAWQLVLEAGRVALWWAVQRWRRSPKRSVRAL